LDTVVAFAVLGSLGRLDLFPLSFILLLETPFELLGLVLGVLILANGITSAATDGATLSLVLAAPLIVGTLTFLAITSLLVRFVIVRIVLVNAGIVVLVFVLMFVLVFVLMSGHGVLYSWQKIFFSRFKLSFRFTDVHFFVILSQVQPRSCGTAHRSQVIFLAITSYT
jgi:hypothetical protein